MGLFRKGGPEPGDHSGYAKRSARSRPHRYRSGLEWYRSPFMSDSTPSDLSLDEARHVAKLARLQLSDEELEACRHDLVAILDHVATLGEIDLQGVEPMAHPGDRTNRIDPDEPERSLDPSQVLAIAPATEGPFIAVPKVLGGDEGSA